MQTRTKHMLGYLLELNGLFHGVIPAPCLEEKANGTIVEADGRKLVEISAQHQLDTSERTGVSLHSV